MKYETYEEFHKAWRERNKKLLNTELGKTGQFDDVPKFLWYEKNIRELR
jgi:hypothetical protein